MKKQSEDLIVLEPIETLIESVDIPALVKKWEKVPTLDPEVGLKDEQYKIVKAGHLEFVSARNKVERVRKHLKQPALEYGRMVDAKAKEYKDLMAPLEEKLFIERHKVEAYIEEQKQKEIEAEQARVKAIADKIYQLSQVPTDAIGKESKELIEIYDSIEVPDEEIYQERINEAVDVYRNTMHKLENMIETAKKAEESERLIREERERQAEAERKRAEEDAKRIAKLEEEREKLEEERRVFEEEKRAAEEAKRKEIAERELEELERQQKEAAEQLKREQEEEAQRVAEEKKREAELIRSTIEKVEANAIKELTDIIVTTKTYPANKIAEFILEQIKVGNIPAVKWAYDE